MRSNERVDRGCAFAGDVAAAISKLRCDATPSLANSHHSRRSFIMLAVLACMMSALLVATSLLFISQTEAAGSAGSADAAQTRALLWSGTQAVMSRLADQRERLLAGELPELESQMTIYESEARTGVVRLLPFSDGRVFAAEAAKLDLNRIDAESLAATGVVDRATADAIIAWRGGLGRPVQSITELLDVPGVTAETIYGSLESLTRINATSATDDARTDAAANAIDSAGAGGLADILTVFSVEPAVQFTGKRRINLNVPWSDELGKRIEERFGADAAALLKQVFESGTKFDSDASLVKAMRAYNTPMDQWPAILDAFTTETGALHFGRLDINAASREALLGLPGVIDEQAAQIINVRQELSAEERGSASWPVLHQILTAEAFEPLAGRITTRCWTYRIRLAAGEVSADAPDGPLTNPLVQEMVIDLAGPRPRIGYLRDITLLRDAAMIASEVSREPEQSFLNAELDSKSSTSASGGEADDQSPASRPSQPGRPRVPGRGDVAASRPQSNADANTDASIEANDDQDADAPIEDIGPSRIGRWTAGG